MYLFIAFLYSYFKEPMTKSMTSHQSQQHHQEILVVLWYISKLQLAEMICTSALYNDEV